MGSLLCFPNVSVGRPHNEGRTKGPQAIEGSLFLCGHVVDIFMTFSACRWTLNGTEKESQEKGKRKDNGCM